MYNPQLETFIRVADAGSFNKAATDLYITPTAVIKQINLLETSLELKLFQRTHRGLTLTKAGKSLYQDAKYIVQYARPASNATMAKNTTVLPELKISDYPLRKYPRKCPGNISKPWQKHRCCRWDF